VEFSVEDGLALYDPQHHRAQAVLYGRDPAVDCGSYLAWTLWLLGYPDQALHRSHEALGLAQELAHPHSVAFAFSLAAWLHRLRREMPLTQERAEATISASAAHGFPLWLAQGTVLRGSALVARGLGAEGMEIIQQGMAAWDATGAGVAHPYHLALLAEAYGQAGQAEEGLALLTRALATVHKTGERWWEAELYRLEGELLLRMSAREQEGKRAGETIAPALDRSLPPSATEDCFHQALDVARRQQAKSLELRAAMSLALLWQHQGKRAEAYELLVPIYGWFTEGFDTVDLQEAKALLDALV